MWIVRLALRRPYTFVVFAILLLILGPLSILNTPTDIFPNINIPVVSMVWNYAGFSPSDMANRIVTLSERTLTTTVNDIEHIESQSLNGVAVIKIYFQPHVQIGTAVAQLTAVAQTSLRTLPQGTTPPLIIQYSASSVPILQLGLSGQGLSEQQLNDFGLNFIRTQLATVEGASIPYPYGGKQRQVQVDIDLQALQAKGLSPSDVVNAVAAQNLVLPAGTTKIDRFEYQVETNSAPTTIAALNDLPIRSVNGAMIYIHDVAHVRDGFPPQTNIVRVDGQRASLLTIQKTGSASTLEIIKSIYAKLPVIASQLPPQLKITPLSDQSIFVRGAISGVVREALIAACLTAIMILVFLGSWRSTLIIAVSIPLSIICSLLMLGALGETINIMTLGGLALAVGILVDDATVEIENINRNLEEGKEIEQAILDGAAQIAIPAFVSTISICIVFVPMFFLTGVARYLFVPLAEAVVFAMLASYLLSRTIVPTMAKYLLKEHDHAAEEKKQKSRNPLIKGQQLFERTFESLRQFYQSILELCIEHAAIFIVLFFVVCIGSFAGLYPWLGQDFFPSVDAGQFKIHVRARTGTRIEETARLCDEVDQAIRQEIPKAEIGTIIDNIGLPYSGLNLSYSNSAPVGPADADIQVSLAEKHHPTDDYVQALRANLPKQFPGVTFYTLPVDIVTQILNFGLPAPLDIQVIGPQQRANRDLAEKLMNEIKYVPGATDLRIQQPFDNPKFDINVDRTKSQQIGLQQRDVAQSLLVATSGSFQTTPSYWLNPQNGVSYNIAVQSPQYNLDSLQDLNNIPLTAGSGAGVVGGALSPPSAYQRGGTPVQILGNVSSIQRGQDLGTVSHFNIAPVIDIYGNVVNTDLESVDKKMEVIVDRYRKLLPRGSQLVVRGQVLTMRTSFIGLTAGLAFSILLVYLLIVINFQSWLDPFIIISALPSALAGIVWMLFLTRTHISVPALTGSIMCMGVATANSILVVSFAREQLEVNVGDARQSALDAGFTRFRPVIMTALAMIIGMVPMALGLGDGGEQNAPLGRAVIGGLLFATASTLLFVPTFFSVLHGRLEKKRREKAAKNPQTDNDNMSQPPESRNSMSQPEEQPQPEHSAPQQPASRPPKALSAGRAVLLLIVLLVVAGLLAGTGIIGRIHARTKVENNTNALAVPSVIVNPPVHGQPQQEVILPGNLEAYVDSPIYARTNGYLKKWYFDIGAHVRKGQLLAEIESPEVDQELAQARADLATAQTNAGNARTQSTRYQDLLKTDSVSKLDTDNFTTQALAANTTVQSATANVQRLSALVGFEKIYAPFSGIITARNTDVGQLINSGAGGNTSAELFHLAASNTLRLYVNAPQIYSQALKPGMTASLTFNEFPGRTFTGKLVRTSRQIDPTSRTMLVEFDINNRSGELFPGAYTEVHFKTTAPVPSFIVPVSALMFRSEGLRIGTVTNDNKAHLVQVVLGRDDGATVQVIHGLDGDSRVIQDPPDSLIEGESVQIIAPAKGPAGPPSNGGKAAGGGDKK